MSILLDPADGPRPPADYSPREMRLMAERDEALTRMEAWRDDARNSSACAGEHIVECNRLRACLAASEECASKLEDKIRAVHQHPLQSYQGHPPSSSTESRMWQVGFTDGLRAASVLLGRGDS